MLGVSVRQPAAVLCHPSLEGYIPAMRGMSSNDLWDYAWSPRGAGPAASGGHEIHVLIRRRSLDEASI